ncbi:sulfatase-like hydrolase/transferase [Novosphingobium sp. FSY-8]|uniref:Sulfatase-like hydrolase/transferase n=2 Tax=Novosphingobium ovatum TaxID=1908523 RepID=A0ABW9X978_9SPHN|nr:sulfatase-like hydrolase/transferase [Novosphingobium ovatum]
MGGGRRLRIAASVGALAGVLGLIAGFAPGKAAQARGLAPHHAAPAPRAVDARPNIVLIVLDDVGYADIGAFGSEIRTPNIDALASAGLRYNRFDTKAVCSPTRAALLTGRNPQTVGMADLPANVLNRDDHTRDRGELAHNAQTIAQVLRAAGYQTHGLGKWHLAPESEDGSDGHNASWPLQRGFDDFYGFFLGWTDQYHPKLIEGNRRIPAPETPGYHFSTDITDRAIAALTPAKGQARKPQFLYLAYGAGHAPIQVPRPYIDAYRGVYEQGWDALRAERLARMRKMGIVPANTQLPPRNPGDRAWADLTPVEQQVYARFMATYAGFLTHTDEQIGRLVAHLRATGQYDNTLFVFMSDNGAASEAGQRGSFQRLYAPNTMTPEQMLARIDDLGTDRTQSEYQRPWAMAGSAPFRRYKLWPYLGGVRTPLIIAWPGKIRDGGAIRRQYVDVVDLAPTLADVAGTAFPRAVAGRAELPVAGKSIRATLFSGAAPAARQVQYFELRGNRAITDGRWRAVAVHKQGTPFDQDRWMLFDTVTDFAEANDLAARYPARLAAMKALWWAQARLYSTPALAEPPARFAGRESFDESADRPMVRLEGEGK